MNTFILNATIFSFIPFQIFYTKIQVFPFHHMLHETPRDIFPGHGDLGTDFLWGFACKKSLWVSRNAVKCRRSEWECSGHVQNVISLQQWVNKVFWLLPRGIDCVGNVCLSHLLSSLCFFPFSLSLFFLPHSLQGTIISTFPVFSTCK